MNLGVIPKSIHLSSGPPGIDSMLIDLPEDHYEVTQAPKNVGLTPSGILNTNPSTRLGPFCRTAEGAQLLGQVLEFVFNSTTIKGYAIEELGILDTSLQTLAMALLKQATNGWEECCAAIGICFRWKTSLPFRRLATDSL